MLMTILIITIAAFVAYALYTQYGKTAPENSKAARVGASLIAAGAALGALVMSWFKSGAPTP